jgi:hypothetical protein
MPLTARLSDSVPPEVTMSSAGRHPSSAAISERAAARARAALSPTSWCDDGLPNSPVR